MDVIENAVTEQGLRDLLKLNQCVIMMEDFEPFKSTVDELRSLRSCGISKLKPLKHLLYADKVSKLQLIIIPHWINLYVSCLLDGFL